MTKNIDIAKKLIPTDTTETTLPKSSNSTTNTSDSKDTSFADSSKPELKYSAPITSYLDNLLEIFVRGNNKQFNPQANFNFLAGVFANLTSNPTGAYHMRSRSMVDGLIRLAKILPFTEHENLMRRGGSVSVIKNCCFDVVDEAAGGLLLSKELNLIPYILLPLCGPEDFTDEVNFLFREIHFVNELTFDVFF